MEELKKRILKEGTAIGTEIIRVDSFLNHQLDTKFLEKIGQEFAARFEGCTVDRILTVETSGIAVAVAAARYFGDPPVVFARKTMPSTMDSNSYAAASRSFTKETVSVLRVEKKYIRLCDNVLILDDFLAHGEAATALTEIAKQAGANVVGIGVVIEKRYQGGRAKLEEAGYRVESLASIEEIRNGKIIFSE